MVQMPRIVAHRGASHQAPENTLASIELGWQEQADAAEIDVHLTADERVVAIHDADLLRTAGLQAPVLQTPLQTIQTLDAGSWKSPAYAGQRVPTLEQVLAIIPSDKKLLIEIKSAAPAMVSTLAKVVKAGPVSLENLTFIDFNAVRLSSVLTHLPDARCLLLAGAPAEADAANWQAILDRLIEQARQQGFKGLDLSRNWPWNKQMVDRIKQAGLSVDVWTVNDPALALHLAHSGVDAITTDYPGLIRNHLQANLK